MTEEELRRLQRDVENIISDMRVMHDKLSELDTHGTAVTVVRIQQLQDDVKSLRATHSDDVKELKAMYVRQEDSKAADRRVMLGALLSAAIALIMAGVGVVIQIVTRHP